MAFNSTFGRVFSPTFQPRSVVSGVEPWWLSGGIAAANCVAAYQPKGAADYATSKLNLNAPGTNDAIKAGANESGWSSLGWLPNGEALNCLKAPVAITTNYSVFIKLTCSLSDRRCAAGYYNVNNSWVIFARENTDVVGFYNGQYNAGTNAPAHSSGVIGMAGTNCYRDGVLVTTRAGGANIPWLAIGYLGASSYALPSGSVIQAMAIYDITITPTQVGLLTAAMAAL